MPTDQIAEQSVAGQFWLVTNNVARRIRRVGQFQLGGWRSQLGKRVNSNSATTHNSGEWVNSGSAIMGQISVGVDKGHPLVFEGLPGLARGEFGSLTQAVDAPVAAVLGLLFQHLKEGGQGVAVASLGETGYRLGAHGDHLELAAQLADPFLHDTGVGVHHAHPAPTAARLPVSRPS